MTDRYILKGKTLVECPDLMVWGAWMESGDRFVKQTEKDGVKVSTVFLGLDHRFCEEGDPLLFETMVFGGESDSHMDRYCTWEEAEKGHEEMVKKIFPPQI